MCCARDIRDSSAIFQVPSKPGNRRLTRDQFLAGLTVLGCADSINSVPGAEILSKKSPYASRADSDESCIFRLFFGHQRRYDARRAYRRRLRCRAPAQWPTKAPSARMGAQRRKSLEE